MKTFFTRSAAAALLAGAACLGGPGSALADEALFQQFGGMEGLQRIADDMVANSFANPKTAPYFAKASVKRLRVQLATHFCEQIGGPCTYTGSSMKKVHSYLHIDRAAFNALVENLQDAMDKNHVPFRAQNQLLAKLAPMYRDIESPRDAPSSPSLGLPDPDAPEEPSAADNPPTVSPTTAAP